MSPPHVEQGDLEAVWDALDRGIYLIRTADKSKIADGLERIEAAHEKLAGMLMRGATDAALTCKGEHAFTSWTPHCKYDEERHCTTCGFQEWRDL